MALADDILEMVGRRSDLTEAALAEALFGASACRRLIKQGKLQRHGVGGASDPFTYSLTGKHHA